MSFATQHSMCMLLVPFKRNTDANALILQHVHQALAQSLQLCVSSAVYSALSLSTEPVNRTYQLSTE